MGMFSWCCRGCGHELCEGEYVRLNGQKQEYDGYGGSASKSHDYNPTAWHQHCYSIATKDQKLDETPSKHANNQGMGPAKLEFVKGYNPADTLTFEAVVFCNYFDEEGDKSQRWHLCLTDKGLEDKEEYSIIREKACAIIYKSYPPPEFFREMYKEEQDKYYEDQSQKTTEVVGLGPEERSLKFDSLQACLDAANNAIRIPEVCGGAYELRIYGSHEKISGAVYCRTTHQRYDKEWKKLEGLETEVTYMIGKHAEK